MLATNSPSLPLTFSVPSTSIVPAPVGLVAESILPTLTLLKFAVVPWAMTIGPGPSPLPTPWRFR